MFYKNKRGRPRKGFEPKEHIVAVRMEEVEYQEFLSLLRVTKHTKTEAIRIGLRLYANEVKRQYGGQI